MSLAMENKPKRGPNPGTGGRPPGPKKVKLTVSVLPSTVAAIRALGSPGAVLDSTFAK